MNTEFTFAFRRIAALLVLAVALTVGASRSMAQVTIYAKFLDGLGVWAGESTDPGRTGWLKLDSFSFSFTSPSAIGAPPAAVNFNPGALAKPVDRLTPQIFATLAGGSALNNSSLPADMIVEFVRTEAAGPVVFFRVEMRLVVLTSQGTTTAAGDDTVRENVQLVFGAVRITNYTILPTGLQGSPTVRSWSRVLNNATFNVN